MSNNKYIAQSGLTTSNGESVVNDYMQQKLANTPFGKYLNPAKTYSSTSSSVSVDLGEIGVIKERDYYSNLAGTSDLISPYLVDNMGPSLKPDREYKGKQDEYGNIVLVDNDAYSVYNEGQGEFKGKFSSDNRKDFNELANLGANTAIPGIRNENNLASYEEWGVEVSRKNQNFDYQRAYNQDWMDNLWISTKNLFPNMAAAAVGAVGGISSLIYNPDGDYSNAMTEFADWLRNPGGINYRLNPEDEWDFTDAAFWSDSLAGIVETAVPFAIGGAGAGMLAGRIFGAMGNAARGAKAVSWLAKAGVQRGLTATASAATMAYAEAVGSGADVYKKTFDEQMKKGMGAEEARKRASRAAASTVEMGTALNTMLNVTTVLPILNKTRYGLEKATEEGFGALNNATRFRDLGGITALAGTEAAEQTTKRAAAKAEKELAKRSARNEVDGLGVDEIINNVNNADFTPNSGLLEKFKKYGVESGQESVEELNIMLAEDAGIKIGKLDDEQYEKQIGTGLYGVEGFFNQLTQLEYSKALTKEGLGTMFLGAAGGIGMTGIMGNVPFQKQEMLDPNTGEILLDADGKPVTKRMSANNLEKMQERGAFNRAKLALAEDLNTIKTGLDNIEQIRNDESLTEDERNTRIEQEELNLFSINAYKSVASGNGQLLKNVFHNMLKIDNTEEASEKYEKLNERLRKNLEEYKKNAGDSFDQAVVESIEKRIAKHEELIKQQKGATEAMVKGLAKDPTDNAYKDKAQKMIERIEEAEKFYKDVVRRFDYSDFESQRMGQIAFGLKMQIDYLNEKYNSQKQYLNNIEKKAIEERINNLSKLIKDPVVSKTIAETASKIEETTIAISAIAKDFENTKNEINTLITALNQPDVSPEAKEQLINELNTLVSRLGATHGTKFLQIKAKDISPNEQLNELLKLEFETKQAEINKLNEELNAARELQQKTIEDASGFSVAPITDTKAFKEEVEEAINKVEPEVKKQLEAAYEQLALIKHQANAQQTVLSETLSKNKHKDLKEIYENIDKKILAALRKSYIDAGQEVPEALREKDENEKPNDSSSEEEQETPKRKPNPLLQHHLDSSTHVGTLLNNGDINEAHKNILAKLHEPETDKDGNLTPAKKIEYDSFNDFYRSVVNKIDEEIKSIESSTEPDDVKNKKIAALKNLKVKYQQQKTLAGRMLISGRTKPVKIKIVDSTTASDTEQNNPASYNHSIGQSSITFNVSQIPSNKDDNYIFSLLYHESLHTIYAPLLRGLDINHNPNPAIAAALPGIKKQLDNFVQELAEDLLGYQPSSSDQSLQESLEQLIEYFNTLVKSDEISDDKKAHLQEVIDQLNYIKNQPVPTAGQADTKYDELVSIFLTDPDVSRLLKVIPSRKLVNGDRISMWTRLKNILSDLLNLISGNSKYDELVSILDAYTESVMQHDKGLKEMHDAFTSNTVTSGFENLAGVYKDPIYDREVYAYVNENSNAVRIITVGDVGVMIDYMSIDDFLDLVQNDIFIKSRDFDEKTDRKNIEVFEAFLKDKNKTEPETKKEAEPSESKSELPEPVSSPVENKDELQKQSNLEQLKKAELSQLEGLYAGFKSQVKEDGTPLYEAAELDKLFNDKVTNTILPELRKKKDIASLTAAVEQFKNQLPSFTSGIDAVYNTVVPEIQKAELDVKVQALTKEIKVKGINSVVDIDELIEKINELTQVSSYHAGLTSYVDEAKQRLLNELKNKLETSTFNDSITLGAKKLFEDDSYQNLTPKQKEKFLETINKKIKNKFADYNSELQRITLEIEKNKTNVKKVEELIEEAKKEKENFLKFLNEYNNKITSKTNIEKTFKQSLNAIIQNGQELFLSIISSGPIKFVQLRSSFANDKIFSNNPVNLEEGVYRLSDDSHPSKVEVINEKEERLSLNKEDVLIPVYTGSLVKQKETHNNEKEHFYSTEYISRGVTVSDKFKLLSTNNEDSLLDERLKKDSLVLPDDFKNLFKQELEKLRLYAIMQDSQSYNSLLADIKSLVKGSIRNEIPSYDKLNKQLNDITTEPDKAKKQLLLNALQQQFEELSVKASENINAEKSTKIELLDAILQAKEKASKNNKPLSSQLKIGISKRIAVKKNKKIRNELAKQAGVKPEELTAQQLKGSSLLQWNNHKDLKPDEDSKNVIAISSYDDSDLDITISINVGTDSKPIWSNVEISLPNPRAYRKVNLKKNQSTSGPFEVYHPGILLDKYNAAKTNIEKQQILDEFQKLYSKNNNEPATEEDLKTIGEVFNKQQQLRDTLEKIYEQENSLNNEDFEMELDSEMIEQLFEIDIAKAEFNFNTNNEPLTKHISKAEDVFKHNGEIIIIDTEVDINNDGSIKSSITAKSKKNQKLLKTANISIPETSTKKYRYFIITKDKAGNYYAVGLNINSYNNDEFKNNFEQFYQSFNDALDIEGKTDNERSKLINDKFNELFYLAMPTPTDAKVKTEIRFINSEFDKDKKFDKDKEATRIEGGSRTKVSIKIDILKKGGEKETVYLNNIVIAKTQGGKNVPVSREEFISNVRKAIEYAKLDINFTANSIKHSITKDGKSSTGKDIEDTFSVNLVVGTPFKSNQITVKIKDDKLNTLTNTSFTYSGKIEGNVNQQLLNLVDKLKTHIKQYNTEEELLNDLASQLNTTVNDKDFQSLVKNLELSKAIRKTESDTYIFDSSVLIQQLFNPLSTTEEKDLKGYKKPSKTQLEKQEKAKQKLEYGSKEPKSLKEIHTHLQLITGNSALTLDEAREFIKILHESGKLVYINDNEVYINTPYSRRLYAVQTNKLVIYNEVEYYVENDKVVESYYEKDGYIQEDPFISPEIEKEVIQSMNIKTYTDAQYESHRQELIDKTVKPEDLDIANEQIYRDNRAFTTTTVSGITVSYNTIAVRNEINSSPLMQKLLKGLMSEPLIIVGNFNLNVDATSFNSKDNMQGLEQTALYKLLHDTNNSEKILYFNQLNSIDDFRAQVAQEVVKKANIIIDTTNLSGLKTKDILDEIEKLLFNILSGKNTIADYDNYLKDLDLTFKDNPALKVEARYQIEQGLKQVFDKVGLTVPYAAKFLARGSNEVIQKGEQKFTIDVYNNVTLEPENNNINLWFNDNQLQAYDLPNELSSLTSKEDFLKEVNIGNDINAEYYYEIESEPTFVLDVNGEIIVDKLGKVVKKERPKLKPPIKPESEQVKTRDLTLDETKTLFLKLTEDFNNGTVEDRENVYTIMTNLAFEVIPEKLTESEENILENLMDAQVNNLSFKLEANVDYVKNFLTEENIKNILITQPELKKYILPILQSISVQKSEYVLTEEEEKAFEKLFNIPEENKTEAFKKFLFIVNANYTTPYGKTIFTDTQIKAIQDDTKPYDNERIKKGLSKIFDGKTEEQKDFIIFEFNNWYNATYPSKIEPETEEEQSVSELQLMIDLINDIKTVVNDVVTNTRILIHETNEKLMEEIQEVNEEVSDLIVDILSDDAFETEQVEQVLNFINSNSELGPRLLNFLNGLKDANKDKITLYAKPFNYNPANLKQTIIKYEGCK